MEWRRDSATEYAAAAYPVTLAAIPADQFQGFWVDTNRWNRRVVQPARWPDRPFKSAPETVIQQFREGRFTQGVALTASWGKMSRSSRVIWGDRSPESLEAAVRDCAASIAASGSIEDAWTRLTGKGSGQLGWSAVIASKTLHFLCRSLAFEDDPPVALDNAVMRLRVWPAFVSSIPKQDRPDDWRGNSLAAYLRYMTAIRVWAKARGWTTTQLEATLFSSFRT